ncbi:hypothetical protein JL720_16370 [Aureococcus anophagefferens]|nr:hypothetical protein JL720_16370 [Aureococcus anophagefferens]
MRFEWACTALVAAVAWPYGGLRVVRAWRRVKGWDDDDALLDAALLTVTACLLAFLSPLPIMVASPDNYYVDVHRVAALVPAAEAAWAVARSEDHAARRGGWLTDRHANYPTTDIAVSSMDNNTRRALEAVAAAPYLRTFTSAATAARRSSSATSSEAKPFTTFPGYGHALADVAVGELWTHPSQALHAANAVAPREHRYVLIGFVRVGPSWRRWWHGWGLWAPVLREFRDGALHATTYTPRRRVLLRRGRRFVKNLWRNEGSAGRGTVYLAGGLLVLLAVVCSYTTVGVVAWVCFGKDLFSGASAAPAAGRDSDDEDRRHRDGDDDEDAVRALLGAPMRRRRRDANEALPVEWSRY